MTHNLVRISNYDELDPYNTFAWGSSGGPSDATRRRRSLLREANRKRKELDAEASSRRNTFESEDNRRRRNLEAAALRRRNEVDDSKPSTLDDCKPAAVHNRSFSGDNNSGSMVPAADEIDEEGNVEVKEEGDVDMDNSYDDDDDDNNSILSIQVKQERIREMEVLGEAGRAAFPSTSNKVGPDTVNLLQSSSDSSSDGDDSQTESTISHAAAQHDVTDDVLIQETVRASYLNLSDVRDGYGRLTLHSGREIVAINGITVEREMSREQIQALYSGKEDEEKYVELTIRPRKK